MVGFKFCSLVFIVTRGGWFGWYYWTFGQTGKRGVQIKAITILLLLIIPSAAAAHPGGGLIALDANTVIFGDSMYNAVWRLEKGKKSQVTERLQTMDQLWDSLTRDCDEIPSPNWHQDVLADRKARAQRGEAKFLTLTELRSRLRSSEP